MPTRTTLQASDFRKLPRGPYLFDRWRAVSPVETSLGSFNVQLNTEPDAELLAIANALVDFLVKNTDAISRAVYEDYLASCYNKRWMEGCQVPIGLSVSKVCKYLSDFTISVWRERDGGTSGVFYFTPQWNVEHGLYLKVSDGHVVRTDP